MVYAEQGNQFSSYDWQDYLKAHNLQPRISRRGNATTMRWQRASFSYSIASAFAVKYTRIGKKHGEIVDAIL